MKNIPTYVIIGAESIPDLEEKVNKFLKDGYEISGSVFATAKKIKDNENIVYSYYQPMVKYA